MPKVILQVNLLSLFTNSPVIRDYCAERILDCSSQPTIVDASIIFSSLVRSSAKNRELVVCSCVFQANSEELI